MKKRECKSFSSQDLQKRTSEVQDAALVAPMAMPHIISS